MQPQAHLTPFDLNLNSPAVVPWLRVLQLYYYFYTTLKLEYNGTISELNEENSSDAIGILFQKLFKR